ncbi:site-specific integrase [Phycisphaeraceae bacterium D3-23]
MKWVNSTEVPGTDPVVTIGKPVSGKNGKPGRYYHARWTVARKPHTRTLRTGNKQEACRRVIEMQAREQRGEPDLFAKSISVEAGLDEFLAVCRDRGLGPKSLSKYDLVVRGVKDSLRERLGMPANQFGEREFWQYRRVMKDAGLKDKTIYDRLIVVKQAFNYMERVGLIPRTPLKAIKMSKPESDAQPVFTPEQVAAILARATAYERPIYKFLAYTGCRYGEARDVLWSDIDFERGASGFVLISKGGSAGRTKDKESRRIPIHAELKTALMKLDHIGDRVFHGIPSPRYPLGTMPISAPMLLRRVKEICTEAGFENPRQYKLHTFRHFFASMHARAGTSYKYALELMGHSDSRVLDLYYHMYDEDLEKSIEAIRIPPLTDGRAA